jgi:hypothetical protein
MDRQDLAEIAKETQLILKGGFYYAVANDVYPGDAEVTIDLSRPEGEVSSLITPIMWDDIVDCAEQYRQQQVIKLPPPKTLVQVTCETTLQAIYRTYYDGSDSRVLPIMALNFASARNPGGGWLRGADTQEESLARASWNVGPCIIEPIKLVATRSTRITPSGAPGSSSSGISRRTSWCAPIAPAS